MATVVIEVTVPGGSPVDITDSVLFSRSTFESEFNGAPGSCDIYVRDPDLSLSFVTGSELTLTVDGVVLWGGYITNVGMTSFAPAADTSDLATYRLALWHLSGPDYNIVLDRRVFRNTSNYLRQIKINEDVDGAILRTAINSYTDMSDFSTSGIDDIATIPDIDGYVLLQQGWKVRQEFETLLPFSGAVYYVDGTKVVVYKAYDDVEKRWGFSDSPNNNPITPSPASYQGATYGFAKVEGTEDASYMANDVFVWGGSEWAGAGGTVFSRATSSSSITDHHRWQHAEAHFGERGYRTQAGVDAVSDAILNGPPGTDATGQEKGLKKPQWAFTFTWLSTHVPLLSGVPDHIRAGDLVTISLSVFGVTKLLPVRTLRISFPDAFINPATDDRVVQFEGTFGLQLSDSFTLWRYVLKNQARVAAMVPTQPIVDDASTTTTFGASYSGEPTPAPDDATVVFTIPFGYISGTVNVYLNGLLQRAGTDFTESDNLAGEITFTSAPLSTDTIFVTAFTLDS